MSGNVGNISDKYKEKIVEKKLEKKVVKKESGKHEVSIWPIAFP